MKTFQTSKNYTAYLHPVAGLIVQSTRTSKGGRMRSDHPQYAEYVDAFENAIDLDEADALCRALLN